MAIAPLGISLGVIVVEILVEPAPPLRAHVAGNNGRHQEDTNILAILIYV